MVPSQLICGEGRRGIRGISSPHSFCLLLRRSVCLYDLQSSNVTVLGVVTPPPTEYARDSQFYSKCSLEHFSSAFFSLQSKTLPPGTFFLPLDARGAHTLYWRLDYDDRTVSMELHSQVPTGSWLALGFSDYGDITSADLCFFWTDWRGHTHLEDTWTTEDGKLYRDAQQDCHNWGWQREGDVIKLVFSKKFDTCDDYDYVIEEGTTHVVWATGPGPLFQLKRLDMTLTDHGFQRTQLLKNLASVVQMASDVWSLTVTEDNNQVPGGDTTYWCKVVRLDERLSRKHHIVKFEPVITQGNEPLVHHMELFHCEGPADKEFPLYRGPCDSEDRPEDIKVCKKVLAAWAMGATPFYFPQEAGLPVGGEGYNLYAMLEVHYNNPELREVKRLESDIVRDLTPSIWSQRLFKGIQKRHIVYKEGLSGLSSNPLQTKGVLVLSSGAQLSALIALTVLDFRRCPKWNLNPHLVEQKPICHLKLGNLMDVQERHITNQKCQDSGVQGVHGSYQSRHKGVPLPVCFDWRDWFRAGFSFFLGDMTDWIDSSGLRVYVSPTLRQHDAGVIELGLEYIDKMAIPPGQPHFPLSSYCISECTRVSIPPEGITVFGSQLHTHLTGIRVMTRHIRDGRELPELNRDNHYSTHFQEIRLLKRAVKVLPGDALITTCLYNTTGRPNITLGGFAITDEMCVNYIYYYPKNSLEVCKSAISDQSLQTYFRQVHEWERQPTSPHMGISDNYRAIDWNPVRASVLHELYLQSPIYMQCNQSSGERFPGDWTSVPVTPVLYPLPPSPRICD
ncbi:hypothetical protein J6590_029567 [Homalodisca vitripennis]|nr:hypothetical protein J6590_029567 [Homalodisca vitripennis]